MGRSRVEKFLEYLKAGEVHKVKSYLRKHSGKIRLNSLRVEKERTPLHIACLLGEDACMRILLKHGADTDVVDTDGNTPLHLALLDVLKGNVHGYYDMVMPLLKECPEKVLHQRNRKGETPQQLLEESKELMEQRAAEDKQEEMRKEESESKAEEDRRWREKLCGEWEDEYEANWGVFEDVEEREADTYDTWADRLSEQFHRKHRKRRAQQETPSAEDKKKQKQQEQEDFQKKLEKEHQEYLNRASKRDKETLLAKKQEYEKKCSEVFQQDASQTLSYSDIPWPNTKDNIRDMVKVLFCDVDKSDKENFKKYLKSQQVLWHPDRFLQKCGARLKQEDKDKILEKVTELSQELNRLAADGNDK
ncbi:NF-kappa-B inhibitor-like protein 1 [Branchiostoma floridae x Branchiostoma belcheri]